MNPLTFPSSTDAWEHLTAWYRQWNQPIQVLVSQNADSAAALHTLSALLRTSRILFEIHPIMTIAEMASIVNRTHADLGFPEDAADEAPLAEGEEDEEGTPEAYFFCLGCGHQSDLKTVFRGFRHSRVHVLDAHRPVKLENLMNPRLFSESKLFLWTHDNIVETIDNYFRQQRIRMRQKRRREARAAEGRGEEDENGFDDDEDDDEDDEDGTDANGNPTMLWLRDLATVPTDVVEAYYSSLASGRSIALELCDFSILINRLQQDYTWHAAIGVTDLFMRRHCDRVTYSTEILKLRDAVNRRRGALAAGAAHAYGGSLAASSSTAAASEQVTLSCSYEYPAFFMLRHWSLWSSLMFQPEVCNALELFTDSGEARLQSLLAECGVSRKMSEKNWTELSQEERVRILPLLAEILKECVPEFTVNTVSRVVGFSAEITAYDACRLFNATMATAVPPHEVASMEEGGGEASSAAAAAKLSIAEQVSRRLAAVQRNLFWKAHEVLVASSHTQHFKTALEEAKRLQCDISLATSSLIVQRGAIYNTRTVYYSPVSDRTSQAVESFWTPARILALADAVVQTLSVVKNRGKPTKVFKPLMLACAIPPAIAVAIRSSNNSAQRQQQGQQQQQQGAANAEQQQFLIGYSHEFRVLKSRPFQPIPIAHHLRECVAAFIEEDIIAVKQQAQMLIENSSGSSAAAMAQRDAAAMVAMGGKHMLLDGVEPRWLVVTGQDRTNHLVEAVHLSLNNVSGGGGGAY